MYVGGERVASPNSGCLSLFCGPNNTGVTVQSTVAFAAFVEYFIPAGEKKTPIVLVPGRAILGNTFQMKPPGGESWTEYFLSKGYPVYLFTQPGRGPAFTYTDQVNNEIQGIDPPNTTPLVEHFTGTALGAFGVGPSFGTFYPDTLFPKQPDFYTQALANWSAALGPAGPVGDPRTANATTNALINLLEKIGPAIVMGHSSGGSETFTAASQRPELFKAVIGVEPAGCDSGFASAMKTIPTFLFWGSYSQQRDQDFPVAAAQFGADNSAFVTACTAMAQALRQYGDRAGFLVLDDIGIKGGTHFLMYDTNNIQIADLIVYWLLGNGTAGLPLR